MAYENKSNWTLGENKPNSNPNKANSLAVSKMPKMNITSATTVNYINELRTTNYELIMKNKANSNPISVKAKMNANLFVTKDYENETALGPQKNKPKQSQFHLPPKPPIFSQNNSPSILPGYQIIFHNHRALAVGFAGFIYVNSALCLFYHFNCLWYLVQPWDLEYFAALRTPYPSVGSAAVKQPNAAASWALCDNLHQYIPYRQEQNTEKQPYSKPARTQNILPADSIVSHYKLPSCPIISLYHKRYCPKHKKPRSVAQVGEIFLDLAARIC